MLVGPLHIRKTCVFDWFFQMKTQNVGKYICIIKIKTYLAIVINNGYKLYLQWEIK